jgi:hypothetical protein
MVVEDNAKLIDARASAPCNCSSYCPIREMRYILFSTVRTVARVSKLKERNYECSL